jgi:lipopolysaccharide/colanic/teichoic acid biosynthesis glycosyltransferase
LLGGIGVPLEEWPPAPPHLEPLTFTLIARLLREKGVREFAEAARRVKARHPGVRFLLIGPLDTNPGAIPEAEVRSWVEEGILEWIPWTEDVRPYLRETSVYVLPSYREGVPRSTQEAMAMARPVITTDAPGCRETVIPGVNGFLVPPRDPEALAQAMMKFLEEPHLVERMGKESRRLAEERFDAAKACKMRGMERLRRLGRSSWLKRLLDVVGASVALLIFGPLMLYLAFRVRQEPGSPVLFRQVRPGLGGKPFVMYKFRTMTEERDEQGNLLPDEKRLTPFGAFLRAWSLDELPELFNVLKGDMSLVGPRPLLMQYLDRYTPEQFRRHEVKPGITGWAQVHGRNALTWEEKFKLDVWYVDNWSVWLDLKILLLTLIKVLKREGISAPGHATMPEFRGQVKGETHGN